LSQENFIMQVERKISFEFGEVLFQRNNRSKYIRIKVDPEQGVIVSVPASCPEENAISFVYQKELWIRKSLAKTMKVKNRYTVFDHQTPFATRFHQLELIPHNKSTLRFEVIGSGLKVNYPEFAPLSNERIQKFIRHAITQTLRFEAKQHLPDRTRLLAEKLVMTIQHVQVRNNKTRWGSCSGKNSISLNIHLMRLPENLCDYVIVHELGHVVHKNHSKRYWDFLEQVLPGAKKLDKQLNQYHLIYW
jgi:predicted metal-dependent hydrolase